MNGQVIEAKLRTYILHYNKTGLKNIEVHDKTNGKITTYDHFSAMPEEEYTEMCQSNETANWPKNKNKPIKQDWFVNNMQAIPTNNTLGDCSRCVFRNIPNYCRKLVCSYDCSLQNLNGNTVYWLPKHRGLIGSILTVNIPDGLAEWFDNQSILETQRISQELVKKALENQK